jgi:hypothetical protein
MQSIPQSLRSVSRPRATRTTSGTVTRLTKPSCRQIRPPALPPQRLPVRHRLPLDIE